MPKDQFVPKPQFQRMVLRRIADKANAIPDIYSFLVSHSPVAVHDLKCCEFLRYLYPDSSGERILIFNDLKSQGQFLWEAEKGMQIQEWQIPHNPDGAWFLPQPVDGRAYPNPRSENKVSRRSEESITAFRYVVLESDEADAEDWLRCAIQLPLRIVSICESGGRSIHVLVRVDAKNKSEWDEIVGAIKPILVTLGADPAALTAIRLTRLPQAMRGNRMQRLIYLNPNPDGLPIWINQSGQISRP